jgi:hypothetical protein
VKIQSLQTKPTDSSLSVSRGSEKPEQKVYDQKPGSVAQGDAFAKKSVHKGSDLNPKLSLECDVKAPLEQMQQVKVDQKPLDVVYDDQVEFRSGPHFHKDWKRYLQKLERALSWKKKYDGTFGFLQRNISVFMFTLVSNRLCVAISFRVGCHTCIDCSILLTG